MTTFVPTERMLIRPEFQGDYKPSAQRVIKFFIPPSVGFIDTKDLVLRSTIELSASGGAEGYARPNPRAAMASLFRTLSIRSGTNNAVIEELQSYNGLVAADYEFEQNESIYHQRTLTEGLNQSRLGGTDSLYWTAQAFNSTAANINIGTAQNTAMSVFTTSSVQTAQPLQTELPLHKSGILGPKAGKTFPVVATGGLRVELQMDEVARALLPYEPAYSGSAGSVGENVTASDAVTAANPITPGTRYFLRTSGIGKQVDANGVDFKGMKVGMELYTLQTGPEATVKLGVIGSLSVGAADGRIVIGIDRASADGAYPASGSTITVGVGQTVFVKHTDFDLGYTLRDLALVFNRVEPPAGYTSSLMKKVGSGDGLDIEYRTWSMLRNTLPSATGMLSQNIPCVHPEAYSIWSIPYKASSFNHPQQDNFEPDHSGIKSYQYFIAGEAIPNRAVDMSSLAEAVPKPDPLHTREMTKALANAGTNVRNLIGCQKRSIIGRALSVLGQVADLSNGDVRLQTEYGTGADIKQFDHHINYCATMNIQDSVVAVQR